MVAKTDPDAAYQIEFGLHIRDIDRTRRFYCDLIGCEPWAEIPLRPFSNGHVWAVTYGNVMLKFLQDFDKPADDDLVAANQGHYMTFHVTNLEEIVADCEAAGVTILRKGRFSPTVEFALVLDPDGNTVEFSQGSPWVFPPTASQEG
jgi:catechol 2,3-dioxygenase-like lactoylglutathione lyase family enzyme